MTLPHVQTLRLPLSNRAKTPTPLETKDGGKSALSERHALSLSLSRESTRKHVLERNSITISDWRNRNRKQRHLTAALSPLQPQNIEGRAGGPALLHSRTSLVRFLLGIVRPSNQSQRCPLHLYTHHFLHPLNLTPFVSVHSSFTARRSSCCTGAPPRSYTAEAWRSRDRSGGIPRPAGRCWASPTSPIARLPAPRCVPQAK